MCVIKMEKESVVSLCVCVLKMERESMFVSVCVSKCVCVCVMKVEKKSDKKCLLPNY